jgi:hypothetical protein
MTDSTPAHAPAPGWYADPSGAPQQRWWDGMQWNEATQPNPAPAYSFGATTPYSHNAPAFESHYNINPNTPQVWVIALAPLLVIVELAILFGLGLMSMDAIMSEAPGAGAVDVADLILRVVAYTLVIVLAVFDHRELSRRGVDRPFHWGFAFLGIVYMIGRTVVVKSRTGRGLAPLFVWIGAGAVGIAVPVAVGVIMAIVYSGQTF